MKKQTIILILTMMIMPSFNLLAQTEMPLIDYTTHANCDHSLEIATESEESIRCQDPDGPQVRDGGCPIPGSNVHIYNQMRYKGIRRDKTPHGGITGDCIITTAYSVYTKECSCGANDGSVYYTFIGTSHSGC